MAPDVVESDGEAPEAAGCSRPSERGGMQDTAEDDDYNEEGNSVDDDGGGDVANCYYKFVQ